MRHPRGFDVPPTKIEFHHRYKTLYRIVDIGHGQQRLRVCHEATKSPISYERVLEYLDVAHFVILSSIDLGSKMNVGRTTLLRSAPGRSCEMIWERTMSEDDGLSNTFESIDFDKLPTIALICTRS